MSILKALRLQKGWTIRETCKRSGINEQKYMRIENHQATLSIEEANELAGLFDVDVLKLFEATRVKVKEMEEIV